MRRQLSAPARAVVGVLDQKLRVVEACGADAVYARVCPLVGASVGQHLRHSLDHIRRAAEAARDLRADPQKARVVLLRYDERQRATEVETSLAAAAAACLEARETLVAALEARDDLLDRAVFAEFTLDAAATARHALPSTLARELAFAAHHAFHHHAMIKIIAGGLGLDLPPDLGRAPATVQHDLEAATAADRLNSRK